MKHERRPSAEGASNCPSCGSRYNRDVKSCPSCGQSASYRSAFPSLSVRTKGLIALAALLLFFAASILFMYYLFVMHGGRAHSSGAFLVGAVLAARLSAPLPTGGTKDWTCTLWRAGSSTFWEACRRLTHA